MTTNNAKTATVEVLTAEVRTLQVSSRQITLSVYRQLDYVDPGYVEAFGRINDSQDQESGVYVVGRSTVDGSLVRSRIDTDSYGWARLVTEGEPLAPAAVAGLGSTELQHLAAQVAKAGAILAAYPEWCELPLIVLAGLR